MRKAASLRIEEERGVRDRKRRLGHSTGHMEMEVLE